MSKTFDSSISIVPAVGYIFYAKPWHKRISLPSGLNDKFCILW